MPLIELRREKVSKRCYLCKQIKPFDAFHRDSRTKDGYRFLCKVCTKESRQTPEYLANQRETGRRYRQRHSEKERERSRQYWKRNPDRVSTHAKNRDALKEQARHALRNAVMAGTLGKPKECQDCRRVARLHGHHDDYTRPLEVAWLCSLCHGLRHRKAALALAKENHER